MADKMRNRVVIPPAVEPITLEEARLHLRITDTSQDTLITSLIKGAREYVEGYCTRSLVTQTREQLLDWFEDSYLRPIRLFYGQIQSIETITYIDADGTEQTVDGDVYQLDSTSEPARLVNMPLQFWPITRTQMDAVTIRYIAGYAGEGSPLDLRAGIPETIKTAIKMLVSEWFENREASTPGGLLRAPFGVEALLTPYRVVMF